MLALFGFRSGSVLLLSTFSHGRCFDVVKFLSWRILGCHWILWPILCRRGCWSPLWKMLCCRECHACSSLQIRFYGFRFFPDGCLAVSGIPVDTLPPLALWSLSGRCFAADSVLTHFLADVLPSWSLGFRWRIFCRVLCVDTVPPRHYLFYRQPLCFLFCTLSW